MLESTHIARVEWKIIKRKKVLYFTFNDILRLEEANKIIVIWNGFMNALIDNEKVVLVWDSLKMENYEAKARIAWQETIKKHKDKIAEIWLVTNNIAIQAGAEIISYFTSYPIKVVSSYKELEEKLN